MIARGKVLAHGVVLLVTLAVIGFFLFAGLYTQVPIAHVTLGPAVVAGIAAVVHLAIALRNPNRQRELNRQKAASEVGAGEVQLVRAGSIEDVHELLPILTRWHGLALAVLVSSVLPFLAPCLLLGAQGWPVNPVLTPRVVSPGDEVSFFFVNQSFHSVRGFWRGTPTIQVLNAAEVGYPETLPGRSNDATWGDWMLVGKLQQNCAVGPTARVSIPNQANLGGKTLRLRAVMPITYPALVGERTLGDRSITVTREFSVQLAEPGASHLFYSVWQVGAIVGLLGSVLGAAALVWRGLALRSLATARVMTL